MVDPLHGIEWWVALACAVPALLLTVLIVMDQQITAVIVNRKDNKLKVHHHLNCYCLYVAPST